MKHEFGIEDVFGKPRTKEVLPTPLSEAEAETKLELLLAKPENAFLTEVAQNRTRIESADTAREALAFAEERIRARLESTLAIKKAVHGHTEHVEANVDAIVTLLNEVLAHESEIGRGADGRVVIDTTEMYAVSPEVCYKLALSETAKRGRNSMVEEIELQSAFYDIASARTDMRIGVPAPYYEIDMGSAQMIVMEKLHARSVDDILRGFGSLPEAFDVDEFCDALKAFIGDMHAHHLYHRDLHYGNIMITQDGGDTSAPRPLGYVIDFGLSGYGQDDMDPYRKEVAGTVFTYDDDYGRIESVRHDLKGLQDRVRKIKEGYAHQ